jgi:transcriptional regulator with GAF, ATPase, and Fis domain
MERFREVLLSVWREACRHIECQESTAAIAALLANHLPIERLVVRRFDAAHQLLETIAAGGARGESLPAGDIAHRRTTLSPALTKRFVSWARHGDVAHDERGRRVGIHSLLAPSDLEGTIIAGPLAGQDGPAGVVLLVAASHKSFKPVHLEMAQALLEPFSAALENDRRLHELAALREAAEADRRTLLSRLGRKEMSETIVGADSGLRHVMERVALVAQSDVPVLILGDTGTGKEVVSRAIHSRSAREHGPFIRVNCGAIPAELVDSQLFGHERGSFTGAQDMRKGWFERADGGTLFLDEIGELPLAAQVRLLRVLQDGFIERVGGQQPLRVDVRIVAATHRNLATMVKGGAFREDLWYRINVFPILMPRLRERKEDIPALARHFARRAATRFGLSYVEPTSADLQALADYSWPGNIRELGAVVDRAVILGNGQRLEVAKALGVHFADEIPSHVALDSAGSADDDAPPVPAVLSTLDAAMKRHIQQALTATNGKIEGRGGAAELLGINPHTLRARMRKLKIDWSTYRPGAETVR